MNFTDILKLKDKDSIDSLSGKVVALYEKTPTPGQKNAGIHPQDVVLQDENGDKLRLKINKATMHLPNEARGRTFKFESAPNDRGKLVGITKNVFNGNHTVNIFDDAIITGDKAMKKEYNENSKQFHGKGYVPAEQPLTPQGRIDIDDHVAALCSMVRKVDVELGESAVADHDDYPDFLVRLATTVYIQACKDYLIPKKEAFNPVVLPPTEAPCAKPEAPCSKPEAGGFPSPNQIVDMAFDGTLTTEELKKFDELAQYNWEEIYDEVADRLVKRGHDRDDVDCAFDDAKAHFVKRTKNFSSPEFCKVVLTGVPSFVDAVEAAHEKNCVPKPVKSASRTTDDIPF